MDQIKRLLHKGDLQEANQQLAELIRSPEVAYAVLTTIEGEVDFWRDILARHEFRIVPDGTDMEQIVAPRYVNVMTSTFFRDKINDLDDVLRYSIHGGAHYKCEQLWKNCPVPMDTFNEDYIAWIEDIYGQRFVHQTAPYWHADMYITALYYFEYHNKQNLSQPQRDVLNMLRFGQPVADETFRAIHAWLYQQDATLQQTFNHYMVVWANLAKDAQHKDRLDAAFTI